MHTITSYQWTVDGVVVGTAATLTCTLSAGLHTVRLDIADDDGQTAFRTTELFVNSSGAVLWEIVSGATKQVSSDPVFAATLSREGFHTVTLTVTSVNESSSRTCEMYVNAPSSPRYVWNIDGTPYLGSSVSHTFVRPEYRSVSLSVTDRGVTVSRQVEFYVGAEFYIDYADGFFGFSSPSTHEFTPGEYEVRLMHYDVVIDSITITSIHKVARLGIRIILGNVTPDGSLAIYDEGGGVSAVHIAESLLPGITGTYAVGRIANEGISPKKQRADFRRGGALLQLDGLNLKLDNTDQYFQRLKQVGVELRGKQIIVTEYIGSDADADLGSSTVYFSGVIRSIRWAETVLHIECKNARESRRANILTAHVVTTGDTGSRPNAPDSLNNKIFPATFGVSDPVNGRTFKFPRTNALHMVLSLGEIAAVNDPQHVDPVRHNLFNVVSRYLKIGGNAFGYVDAVPSDIGKSITADSAIFGYLVAYNNTSRTWWVHSTALNPIDSLPYNMSVDSGTGYMVAQVATDEYSLTALVRLGYMDSDGFPVGRESFLVGKYAIVKDGPNTDSYRKITAATMLDTGGQRRIWLTFADNWPLPLRGHYDGVLEEDSSSIQDWIQIASVGSEYEGDDWPCKGFYDSDDAELDGTADLYAENSGAVRRVPGYALAVNSDTENKDSLILSNTLYLGSSNSPSGVIVLPINTLALCSDTTLGVWGPIDTDVPWSSFVKVSDGYFHRTGYELSSSTIDAAITNATLAYDRDKNSHSSHAATVGTIMQSPAQAAKAFVFSLPELPQDVVFTKVYLGLKILSRCTTAANITTSFYIGIRGFVDRVKKIVKQVTSETADFTIDSLPETYYLSNGAAYNSGYYAKRTIAEDSSAAFLNGYLTFELTDVVDAETYNAVTQAILLWERSIPPSASLVDETLFYEMAVILEGVVGATEGVLL